MQNLRCSPAQTLEELLSQKHYTINYYQREYRWQRKQIEELIEDLTSEFMQYYKSGDPIADVEKYGIYFMGSIVITQHDNAIIDGQQRLTSLTLLLIYLNNELKKIKEVHEGIPFMIASTRFGKRSFNLDIEERKICMECLYNGKEFDTQSSSESVKNLKERYNDIEELFPKDKIEDRILLHFCDWLINKVQFVKIETETEQDAYKVFVTMNDRGLNLTSTEMLKGYLLSEIKSEEEVQKLNKIWKDIIYELKKIDDKEDEIFIKAWLRAQYAITKRDKSSNATKEDFDLIAGPFHKWIRDNHEKLGLKKPNDFVNFIYKFKKFASIYLQIKKAENNFKEDSKYIYYNAQLNFTQQTQLLLAPICDEDDEATIKEKMNLVARFIDLYIFARATNYRSLDYSTIRDYIFDLTKTIRHSSIADLKRKLKQAYGGLNYDSKTALPAFKLNNKTKRYIKNILARITGYIEESMDSASQYLTYISKQKDPFEIEHILANNYEYFEDEFDSPEEFQEWRNNIGALLLLKKSVNASLGDADFNEKLRIYASSGNIYSASLGRLAYTNYPRFKKFYTRHNLHFHWYEKFGKAEILERNRLLVELANLVWNTQMFDAE